MSTCALASRHAVETSDTVLIAGALSLLGGTVHAGLAPDHLAHAPALGSAFVLAAAGQTAWSAAALTGLTRRLVAAGLALNVVILAAWILSRTAGLPFGPAAWVPEPVGALDALTALVELSLCGLLAGRGRLHRVARQAGLAGAAALVCLLVSGMAHAA